MYESHGGQSTITKVLHLHFLASAFLLLILVSSTSIQESFSWFFPKYNSLLILMLMSVQISLGLCTTIAFIHEQLIGRLVVLGAWFAGLSAMGLFIVRRRDSYAQVSWNVDWRNALSSAFTFAKDPSGDSPIDYSEISGAYHYGASFLAGHFTHTTGSNPDFVLFFLIPVVALTSICALGIQLVRTLYIHSKHFLLSLLPVLSIPYPGLDFSLSGSDFEFLISKFIVNDELMINSLLGVSIVCFGLFLILNINNFIGIQFTIAIVVSSLIFVKPQYIPFAILIFIMLLILTSPRIFFWKHFIGVITFSLIPTAILSYLRNSNLDVKLEFVPITDPSIHIWLLLALFFTVFIVIDVVKGSHYLDSTERSIVLLLAFSVFLVYLANFFIFSINSQEYLAVRNLGVGTLDPTSIDRDMKQGFFLVYIFCLLLIGVLLVSLLKRKRMIVTLMLFFFAPIITVKLMASLNSIVEPSYGYEYVNLKSLEQILERVPQDSKILVNDMNDPAENYRRPGRGEYWTSIGEHEYFFSSIIPNAVADPNVISRFKLVRSFFSSTPKPTLIDKLRSLGVKSVVINLRCRPNWFGQLRADYWNKDFAYYELADFSSILRKEKEIAYEKIRGQLQFSGESGCI